MRVQYDQGTWWRADLPDLDPQMKNLPALEPSLPMPRKGRVIAPHMTRTAGNNSRKLSGPVALEAREGWAVLITPRAKAVSGMEGPPLPRGWG